MKKLITLMFIPFVLKATEIDKIIYNGKEAGIEVSLNSDLRIGENLNISKIDRLVDNFKYVKSNKIDIKIEPSNIDEKSNIVITNIKSNPFKLSLGFDNYGENKEEGIYRYNIGAGIEGLILNEKLDIDYTFVSPILSNRKENKSIEELLPGEELEENFDKRYSRRNENFNINLSFPIKNNKIYLIYSNSIYLKSLISENDNIYDISGNSNRFELKVDRSIDKDINIFSSYSYLNRKSYVEDVLNKEDNIHNISIGISKNLNKTHKMIFKFDNIIENGKYLPSLAMDYNFKDILRVINVLNNKGLNTDINLNLRYQNIYSEIGFNTDYIYFLPKAKLGINFELSKLNVDMSLEYNKRFKTLFALKLNLIR